MRCFLSLLLTVFLIQPASAMGSLKSGKTTTILETKFFDFLKSKDTKTLTPYHCVSQTIGVEFACDPQWPLYADGKNFIITISEDPLIMLNIQEHDQSVRFTSEITREGLLSTARYAPDFRIDRLHLCDREIVKASGSLLQDAKAVVEDYYFIDHQKLHTVQFTAASSKAFKEYQSIIRDIIKSFNFITHAEKVPISETTADSCADIVEKGPKK